MYSLRVVTDLAECRYLWQRVIPEDTISDMWDVRNCFHEHFRRPPFFIVLEDSAGIGGLLPLSWIEEHQCYGFFPGETWDAKTWLEQNRIYARNESMLQALLQRCPRPYHLRYLAAQPAFADNLQAVDEIGYLFVPGKYGYDMENYYQQFSHKTAKRIRREIGEFDKRGVQYRYDDLDDFDRLVQLSVGRYGSSSYFYDDRFRESFRSLMHLFHEKGFLRITTVLIDNETAAIDLGAVYRGVYTLLAGGTHASFPGVAKLINTHHMQRACEEKFDQVDFLCGDFSWKILFHLEARPLYLLSNSSISAVYSKSFDLRSQANV